MPKISKTFCPAKWDDLHLNFNYNWAYACCKATPIEFVDEWKSVLDKQKENLLNDIQDPSCEYCWKIERNGGQSDRMNLLLKFNPADTLKYHKNPSAERIEVNLGNECNFQCTYCSPKFSSKWDTDIKTNPYKFKSDLYHYAPKKKNSGNLETNLDFLKTYDKIKTLNLIGGEPLQNKNLFHILDKLDNVETLHITTNFSCSLSTIDKIIKLSHNYKHLVLGISIDATEELAEFVRYGLDYKQWKANVDYLFDNLTDNMEVIFLSLITSLSIKGLKDIIPVIDQYHSKNNSTTWRLSYCTSPKIQSFSTLLESKDRYVDLLNKLQDKTYVKNIESITNVLQNTNFDKKLYKELLDFIYEFAERKKISIPKQLNAKAT
jgi:organic radical activating enzyme